jgi:hypothetical protein
VSLPTQTAARRGQRVGGGVTLTRGSGMGGAARRWVTTAVDDQFPTWPVSQSHVRPLFASPKPGSHDGVKEIWPMVMEKAWAKLHGSYEATDAGDNHDALQYLTGGCIRVVKLADRPRADPALFKELVQLLEERHGDDVFVGCGRVGYKAQGDATKVGLVKGHAYALLHALEPAPGLQLVKVQNPWGKTEWNGSYSDAWPGWTEELKSLVAHSAVTAANPLEKSLKSAAPPIPRIVGRHRRACPGARDRAQNAVVAPWARGREAVGVDAHLASDGLTAWARGRDLILAFGGGERGAGRQANDGTFFMDWADFAEWFGECRIVDPRWEGRLGGVWCDWLGGRRVALYVSGRRATTI